MDRCKTRTFVETLLAVHDGDPAPRQAGGSVQLTVVLVKLAIGATDRLIVWFTEVQTLALSQARLAVHHTVTTQAAVLVLTGSAVHIVSHETCGYKQTGQTCVV